MLDNMPSVDENAAKTRPDGMPVGTPFTSDRQPEGRGRPKGAISLETRIKRILEEGVELPESLKAVIRNQCGGDKNAADAMIIVGILQALQGDSGWFGKIMEHGYGKPLARAELTGKDGGKIEHDVTIPGLSETADFLKSVAVARSEGPLSEPVQD